MRHVPRLALKNVAKGEKESAARALTKKLNRNPQSEFT